MKRMLKVALAVMLCVGVTGNVWAEGKDSGEMDKGRQPAWVPDPKPPIQWFVPDNPEHDSTPYVYYFISEAASLESNQVASLAPMSRPEPNMSNQHGAYASTYQWVHARINGVCIWIYMQGYYTLC
jgi:hypothetical protein